MNSVIECQGNGTRLDVLLTSEDLTRSRVASLIREGAVEVNG